MNPEENDDDLLLDEQEEQDPNVNDDLEAEDDEISFGDAEEDGDPTDLAKRLRGQIKERDRVIAVLSRQSAEATERSRPVPVEVGERPTLESCDYDEDRFRDETDKWIERSVAAQQTKAQPNTLEEEAKADVARYEGGIAKLTYADAADVTSQAREALTPQQEYVIATVSDDPALMLYALGKHPEKLRELTEIRNPAKFIAAVARMETKMSVGKRQAPAPERIPQGNAMPKSADKETARLQKDADRTGDYSALFAYKRKLREKA